MPPAGFGPAHPAPEACNRSPYKPLSESYSHTLAVASPNVLPIEEGAQEVGSSGAPVAGGAGLQHPEPERLGADQASLDRAMVGRRQAAQPFISYQGRGREVQVVADPCQDCRRALRRVGGRAAVVAAQPRRRPRACLGPALADRGVAGVGTTDQDFGVGGPSPLRPITCRPGRHCRPSWHEEPPLCQLAPGSGARARQSVRALAGALVPQDGPAEPAGAGHRRAAVAAHCRRAAPGRLDGVALPQGGACLHPARGRPRDPGRRPVAAEAEGPLPSEGRSHSALGPTSPAGAPHDGPDDRGDSEPPTGAAAPTS